jgi:hypothetical protein
MIGIGRESRRAPRDPPEFDRTHPGHFGSPTGERLFKEGVGPNEHLRPDTEKGVGRKLGVGDREGEGKNGHLLAGERRRDQRDIEIGIGGGLLRVARVAAAKTMSDKDLRTDTPGVEWTEGGKLISGEEGGY